MLTAFKEVASDHAGLLRVREAAEHDRRVRENKTREDAIARRRAPFRAAAAILEVLMESDPDFKEFLKRQVATIREGGGATYRGIVSTTFGRHDQQNGWRFEDTPTYEEVATNWYLTLDVLEEGAVKFEIHNNDRSYSSDPADVPLEVWSAFQPTLEILQNREKIYQFLLEKFST